MYKRTNSTPNCSADDSGTHYESDRLANYFDTHSKSDRLANNNIAHHEPNHFAYFKPNHVAIAQPYSSPIVCRWS